MTDKLNRCYWQAASSGSGDFVYASDVPGYLNPTDAGAIDTHEFAYIAENGSPPTEWELAKGTYDAGTGTLTRTTIVKSSNSNALVTFSAAPKVRMGVDLAEDHPWQVLDSGSISSPVEYIDLALPAGFVAFRLTSMNFTMPDDGLFSFALSEDGGATFYDDTSGFAAYLTRQVRIPAANPVNGADSLGFIGSPQSNGAPWFAESILSPGDGVNSAFIYAVAAQNAASNSGGATLNCYLDPSFSVNRVNAIRLMPYGNGDANPPTSGFTFTAGRYLLEGLLA